MRSQKKGMYALMVIAVCVALPVWFGTHEKQKEDSAQKRTESPRVIKVKEVVGHVVGGPQIVTGSPLIGYAVYVEGSKSWGALYANGCPPQLENGQRVVMYQKDTIGDWYTFLRYER